MSRQGSLLACTAALVVPCVWALAGDDARPPSIPKVWDEKALVELEVPLAQAKATPRQVSADYYQRIPVRKVYKSYPVYHPDKEPKGYLDQLQKLDPVAIPFEPARLKSPEDWIKAGEQIFHVPLAYDPRLVADVRKAEWYEKTGMPVAADGTVPLWRYYIREKGKVEVGEPSCATCHTRLLPDRKQLPGAPGNLPLDRAAGYFLRAHLSPEQARDRVRAMFAAPWLKPDPLAGLDRMTVEELASHFDAIPPGVMGHTGSGLTTPFKVPDLFGLRERRFFDHTGRVQHGRDLGNLMRYAALHSGIELLASYDGFIPGGQGFRKLPDPGKLERFSDEQLYALAMYLHSLKPPANPNKPNKLTQRGKEVFVQAECASCHAGGRYTNDRLLPVVGFKVPPEDRKKYRVSAEGIDTDPALALSTRRGTGYYKVPSLLGVWYRGPFFHDGALATLEDVFDPRRLREDYVPTAYKGPGVKSRAVKGHPFGLDLPEEDRKALVAFLKTL